MRAAHALPSKVAVADKATLGAASAPALAPPLTMHQEIGNQAVQHLFKTGVIQARLAVSPPIDPFEQEADKAADIAMRASSDIPQRRCACGAQSGAAGACSECMQKRQQASEMPQLRRRAIGGGGNSEAPSVVHQVLHSAGRPLDPATRAFMEARLGHDFSDVRVHTDHRASQSAEAVSALAYTVGSNVVFGRGQYVPNSHSGRQLLAHELAHVIQQSGLGYAPTASSLQRQPAPNPSDGDAQPQPPLVTPQPSATTHPLGGDATTALPLEPKDKILKPPDPGGELVVHSGTNMTFSGNAEYVRYQLQFYVAVHGTDSLTRFESGDEIFRFGYGLGPFFDTPQPATEERAQYLARVVSLVHAEVQALRSMIATFLSDFEASAHQQLNEMLDASKARVEKERQRYEVQTGGAEASVASGKETEDLTRRARELRDKQRTLVAAKAEVEAAQQYGPHGELPPGGAPQQKEQDKEGEAQRKYNEAQKQYALARNAAELRHPILVSYNLDPLAGTTADYLDQLGSTSSATQAASLAQEISNKHDDIESLRKKVDDKPTSVWDLPTVIDATKQRPEIQAYLGLTAAVRDTALAEKLGATQAEAELTALFTGIALLALGLIAAIPTGGLSLGAVAAVETAGATEAGLLAFSAYRAVEQYSFESAAAGTDFDKAKAISQQEPSLFGLALDIISAGLPKGIEAFAKASEAFGELVGLRRLAIAAKEAGKLDEAGQLLEKLETEGNKIGEGGIGSRLRSETEELAAARVKIAPEVDEIKQNIGKMRPSSVPEYTDEIPLGGDQYWRRAPDGTWCRFASPPMFCINGSTLEGEALEEQLQEIRQKVADSTILGRNLGNPLGPGKWQAHHIIPTEFKETDPVVRLVREHFNWEFNSAENGIWLPQDVNNPAAAKLPIHFTSHEAYSNSIGARLTQLWGLHEERLITDEQLFDKFKGLIEEYKGRLSKEITKPGLPVP
jgi:hypothetical protein